MKLKFLLFMISFGIRLTSIIFPSFRKRMREKNYAALIKTRDESVCRFYSFTNGKFRSKPVNYRNPSFAMVFDDVEYAFKVLSSGSKIRFMKAISTGALKVEGDPGVAIFFLETLEMMGGLYKKQQTSEQPS